MAWGSRLSQHAPDPGAPPTPAKIELVTTTPALQAPRPCELQLAMPSLLCSRPLSSFVNSHTFIHLEHNLIGKMQSVYSLLFGTERSNFKLHPNHQPTQHTSQSTVPRVSSTLQ